MVSTTTEKSYSSQRTVITTSGSEGGVRVTGGSVTVMKGGSTTLSKWQRLLWLGNILYYQLVAVLTVVMLWVLLSNTNLNSPFWWHMFLCTLAYVPLMAVAIISFSKDNLPTLYIPRNKIYLIHGILLSISCGAVTVGISLETNSKIKRGRDHFQSNHAITGLVSWLLVFCSVAVGLVAANSQTFARAIKPVVAKLIHNILGISGFTLGVTAILLMYPSRLYKDKLSSSAYFASYFAAIYIILWSLLAAFKSLFFQIKHIFS